MVNPSLTNIECLTKKFELWIDLDFRYSILKKDYWIQILKLNVGFSLTFYIRDLKTIIMLN